MTPKSQQETQTVSTSQSGTTPRSATCHCRRHKEHSHYHAKDDPALMLRQAVGAIREALELGTMTFPAAVSLMADAITGTIHSMAAKMDHPPESPKMAYQLACGALYAALITADSPKPNI